MDLTTKGTDILGALTLQNEQDSNRKSISTRNEPKGKESKRHEENDISQGIETHGESMRSGATRDNSTNREQRRIEEKVRKSQPNIDQCSSNRIESKSSISCRIGYELAAEGIEESIR